MTHIAESGSRVNDSMKAFHLIGEYLGFNNASVSQPTMTIKDPIFIAVDVGFDHKNITQLGVSTFDTLSLESPRLRSLVSNEYPILTTLWATKVSRYKERRRKRSHFGQRQVLDVINLRSILECLLTTTNASGRLRDVILVGHSITSDIAQIKRSCGLDISSLPMVKAIMDTQRISRYLLSPKSPLSLRSLLIMLKLEYVGLHNSAHDSRYTLRALLAMACKSQRSSASTFVGSVARQVDLVDYIATFHRQREPVIWCENSPRVKLSGNRNIMDQDNDQESEHMLGNLFETD